MKINLVEQRSIRDRHFNIFYVTGCIYRKYGVIAMVGLCGVSDKIDDSVTNRMNNLDRCGNETVFT